MLQSIPFENYWIRFYYHQAMPAQRTSRTTIWRTTLPRRSLPTNVHLRDTAMHRELVLRYNVLIMKI